MCSDGLYNVVDETTLKEKISYGAHALVKYASKLEDDNLGDDTTAVVVDILQADERATLRQQTLTIPKTLKKGDVIDGYELLKPLIQNERTWLVHKKTKDYVVKFAPYEALEDEMILDLFVKEAWNAKRLKCAYFPKAVIPKNRTARYYVMRLIQGENLEHFLTDAKHLSIDDSIALGETLLAMSQYLLKYDLVHGDIKPDNIMIEQDEEQNTHFKIIDFGSISEIFSLDSKAGTPSFLAPERFLAESISESSEIFAIGVTLYRSLTGKYPYGEIEPFQTPTFKETKAPSHYNKNIPSWLDSVILRAISIDKEQRYAHYSEMLYELANPEKVKPYFVKNAPLIERSPLLFYRIAFTVMTLVNFVLIFLLLK